MPKTCNCDPHFAAQRDIFFRHLNLESVCACDARNLVLCGGCLSDFQCFMCVETAEVNGQLKMQSANIFFKDDIGVDKDPIECPQLRRVARGWGEV